MDLEKVPSIGRVITETEKKFNAEEVREEITKLRDDAKEKYKKEIEEGRAIKGGFDRHLLELTDKDIEEIPVDHLEFLDKLNKMESVDINEEYDELSEKIRDLFKEGTPNGIRSILAHKLVELTVKSLPKERAA